MERKNFYGEGNESFACEHCGAEAVKLSGGYRNHCPACLYSQHADVVPGDRQATCGGLMEPVNVEKSSKKGWVIEHRCTKCKHSRKNKAAPDDSLDEIIKLTLQ